jgi:DNA-binding response OmpR family regulator
LLKPVLHNAAVISHTLLIVEDDDGLRDVLARASRSEGFTVVTAADGAQAIRTAATRPVDAVVLDIGLPDSDGRDVCQALRARGCDAPVIFLTARGGVTDRLSGFSSGGDDYLPKPFVTSELFARLRAVLRRGRTSPAAVRADIEVDPITHSVSRADTSAPLSPTEFRLLARMAAPPGGVVRRRELVEAGWPAGAIVSDNTLDQYMRRIRRKLAEIGAERTIRTRRGVGYELV